MIKSTVVADSIDRRGNRITSVLVTFPRIILAELNTHRMLSKNSASSRAIPFNKMVKSVEENPFIPIAWQGTHKGMQGNEYITSPDEIEPRINDWLDARNDAVKRAKYLDSMGITKQLCNRLLEPFMYHTVLITGTDDGWNNFFDLRCPQYEFNSDIIFKSKKEYIEYSNNNSFNKLKVNDFSDIEWLQINKGQAEIHMMALAEAIYDSFNDSIPDLLTDGHWHIPFKHMIQPSFDDFDSKGFITEQGINRIVKIATAMAARTSYTIVGDEKEVSYEKLIEIHDKMLNQKPFHASPFEHCARVMTDWEYENYIKGKTPYSITSNIVPLSKEIDKKILGHCRNYRGFIQYRHFIEQS